MMDVVASGMKEELQYSKNRTFDENGFHYVRGTRIGDFPIQSTAGDYTVTYTVGEQSVTVSGQPKIFGTVFDTAFYGDMTTVITLREESRTSDGRSFLTADIEIRNNEDKVMSSETIAIHLFQP